MPLGGAQVRPQFQAGDQLEVELDGWSLGSVARDNGNQTFDIQFDGYGRLGLNLPRDRICSVFEKSNPGRDLIAGQRVKVVEFGKARFVAENKDGTYRVHMDGEEEACDVEVEFVRSGLCDRSPEPEPKRRRTDADCGPNACFATIFDGALGSLLRSFLCPFDVFYLNFISSRSRSDQMFLLFHLRSACRAWQKAMHQHLFPCLDAAWMAKEKAKLQKEEEGLEPKSRHWSMSLHNRKEPDRYNAGAYRFLDERVRAGLSQFSGVGFRCSRREPSLLVTGAADSRFNGFYRHGPGSHRQVFHNRLTGAVLYHSLAACSCADGVEGHTTQWCNGKWIMGMGKSSQIVSKSKWEDINGKYRVVDIVNEHHKYINEHGAVMYWSEYRWRIKLSELSPEPVYTSGVSSDLDQSAPRGVWVKADPRGRAQGVLGNPTPDDDTCLVECLHDDCVFSTSSSRNAKSAHALLPPLDERWHSLLGSSHIVIQELGSVTPCLPSIRSGLWARDAETRSAALECLAKLCPDENTFEEVIEFTSDESSRVRTTATRLISALATKDLTTKYRVATILAESCLQRRPDFDTCGSDSRRSALDCLVDLGKKGFVPKKGILTLLYRLSRQRASMHEAVLQYLPQIASRGDESARDSILHILEAAKGVEKKGAALKALSLVASRGDSKAVAAVLPFCGGRTKISFWSGKSDRSEEVRSDAIEALGNLCEASDDAAIRTIIEGFGDQWHCAISAANRALHAVAAQGTATLKVVVLEFLEHKDCGVRRQAFSLARQYIGLADSGVQSYLLKALSGADADLRLDCVQAVTLAAGGTKDTDRLSLKFRQTCRSAVLGMLSDTSVFVRFAAITATVRLSERKDQEAATAIKRRLRDRQPCLRIQAIKGLQALDMLKHPDTYPAVLSRLDDECLDVRHAAAAFVAAQWWPPPCMCSFCDSEIECQLGNDTMEADLHEFMKYYEGRYIHQEIDRATVQLVPVVNPNYLMFVDSACLEALRKAQDGSDISRDLIQKGFWDAEQLPDSCLLLAVDIRAIHRSLLQNWAPDTLGPALVKARDLFEACRGSATASATDDFDMKPSRLRELLADNPLGLQEELEEEELVFDDVEESGEEETADFDDMDMDVGLEDEMGFGMEGEGSSSEG
ncbi:unnamed protein product [Symbiodinium sp. CCMP2592]|nr:unnamed protein product [Symbiodinium sp. CCMP2592]